MWQRFTERARNVILFAQEEAGKLNSSHVSTEHLLLGIVGLPESSGARVLQQMGVSLDTVRAATLAALPAPIDPPDDQPKLTPRTKRVLELAADEARRMNRHHNHNYIGSEHLLLALLRQKDGAASSVLRELGLELKNTRAQVTIYLDKSPAPVAATPPASENAGGVAARFRVARDVRKSLDFAAQESRVDGAAQIEIVHLLLALCQHESESARQLSEAGVDVEALRAHLQK